MLGYALDILACSQPLLDQQPQLSNRKVLAKHCTRSSVVATVCCLTTIAAEAGTLRSCSSLTPGRDCCSAKRLMDHSLLAQFHEPHARCATAKTGHSCFYLRGAILILTFLVWMQAALMRSLLTRRTPLSPWLTCTSRATNWTALIRLILGWGDPSCSTLLGSLIQGQEHPWSGLA